MHFLILQRLVSEVEAARYVPWKLEWMIFTSANSVMTLNRGPMQMSWCLKGRLKKRRGNVTMLFTVLWELQFPFISCPFSSVIRQLCLFLRYQILFKQCVGTEDVFFGMSRKDPSTACCEDMVVSETMFPFFVFFLCPFQSCCLLEGWNANTKLYCCL